MIWTCLACGHRNQGEDGPVCESCELDARHVRAVNDDIDNLLHGIETRLWPKGFPCPRCHGVTWAAVAHVDQFRCRGCGYTVDGVEVASWRARNTGS